MDTISWNTVKNLIPVRRRNAHKGDAGRLLLMAGSPGMAGAAVLCARAASKSGAGLVRVAIDEKLWGILNTAAPCATCEGRAIDNIAVGAYDAVCAGPGMGTGNAAERALVSLIRASEKLIVLDADALNIISTSEIAKEALSQSKSSIILTPHPGEAGRLLDLSAAEINADREKIAQKISAEYRCVTVLKGSDTLISSPEGELAKNPTGNPGMATAGSGDVLSGVISAFAGAGMSAIDASIAGVYVHGHAGDLAAEDKGVYGMTAEDIVEQLPYAIKEIVFGKK